MKLTIKEIAKKTGFSLSTVSRALHKETRPLVAPNTLKKIDKIIKEYSFTPNLAAQNLRKSSTKTIGVIFPYLPGIFYSHYYNHILSGVSDYLLTTDYQFKMLLLNENEKEKWDTYDFKSGERVDGLIITHWFKFFSQKSALTDLNLPHVIINDFEQDMNSFFVYVDDIKGGQIAANHLYKTGHRNVAILSGPSWSKDNEQRLKGFQDYYNQKGSTIDPNLIISADFLESRAYECVDQLLERNKDITAIFCCNDQMALGAIRRLNELGIPCPEKISILGYDDDQHTSFINPALTTIHVPIYDLAQEATKRMIDYLKMPPPKSPLQGELVFPVSLIERKSVATISS